MSSTFLDFVPSTVQPFTFQPTLAGKQYIATITWQVFGQHYYLTLTDLSGNVIVSRSIAPCGPKISAVLSWNGGVATVTVAANHNVPLGWVTALRISDTGSGFDGSYNAVATGPLSLTYALPNNPNEAIPVSGNVNFDLNLVGGYSIGTLLFHDETQQFEYF